MKLRDIEKFPFASYVTNVSWTFIETWIEHHNETIMKCDMNPFFQRDYVWTKKQKIAYLEYRLKGGFSGRDIFWNCPTWLSFHEDENIVQLVDGKQRINAVLEFLNNKIPVFGYKYAEFDDSLSAMDPDFVFHINNLQTEKDVVKWYIGFNTGGTVHTMKDLKPAKDYLKGIKQK